MSDRVNSQIGASRRRRRYRAPPDEFTALYAQWTPRLRAAVALELRERDRVDDVVQETFVRACMHWKTVQSLDAPGSWLFRVAYNLIRSDWRRASVAARLVDRMSRERRADSSHAAMDTVVDSDAARDLLARLPADLSDVLTLRYLKGLSVVETAALLGAAEGTVKSRSSRALTTLRGIAKRQDEGDQDARLHG